MSSIQPHHDKVEATLRNLTAKANVKDLSRADVDDMLWAIRQLNERNEVVRDVLTRTDDSILSERDIQRMEQTLDAVRNLYRWVAESRNVKGVFTAGEGEEGEEEPPTTLRSLTDQYAVTLRALRHANPHLDDLRADDPIPANTKVRVPRGRRSASRTSSRSPPASRKPTTSKRSLQRISKQSGVPLWVLREHNPELDDFADVDVIPADVPVRVPTEWNGQEVVQHQRRSVVKDGRDVNDSLQRRSTNTYVTDGNESLRFIAYDVAEMTMPQIRSLNRQLNEFGDDEPLPRGTPVAVDPTVDVPRNRQPRSQRTSSRRRVTDEFDEEEADDGDHWGRDDSRRVATRERRTTTRRVVDDELEDEVADDDVRGRRSSRGRRRVAGRDAAAPPPIEEEAFDDDDDVDVRRRRAPPPPRRYEADYLDDGDDFDRRPAPRTANSVSRRALVGGPAFVTSGRETIDDVAAMLRVPARQLLAANEHLLSFSPREQLPRGIEVVSPK